LEEAVEAAGAVEVEVKEEEVAEEVSLVSALMARKLSTLKKERVAVSRVSPEESTPSMTAI
jgi:transcription initiation factor IIE alpha subunit